MTPTAAAKKALAAECKPNSGAVISPAVSDRQADDIMIEAFCSCKVGNLKDQFKETDWADGFCLFS